MLKWSAIVGAVFGALLIRHGIQATVLDTAAGSSMVTAPAAATPVTPDELPVPAGRLAFAAYRDGNWDIYSIRADGTDLRRITFDPAEDLSPSWSPDGTRLAFQSKRQGNWDVYTLSVREGTLERLTTAPAYDGAPCWSPDGKRLAFDSYRAGDLDIFTMNEDGSSQTDLTTDSQAGDFDPAWSPDGSRLAFTSWRMGDNDIFVMDLATKKVTQWTDSQRPEGNAVWSRDGQGIAYVQDQAGRREVYTAPASQPLTKGKVACRVTWYTRDDSPAWSPQGNYLAYLSHQYTDQERDLLLLQESGEDVNGKSCSSPPRVLLDGWEMVGPLSWTANDAPLGEPVKNWSPSAQSFLTEDTRLVTKPAIGLAGSPHDFVDLPDVTAPNARLNSLLVDSFKAVREDMQKATGYDLLKEVSDMWRGLDASSETSANASWHKTGRAFDMLFDYRDESGMPLMEVVREDAGGETYWRVFLKAVQQNGSLGLPLKTHPWDLSGKARRTYPADGGTWKSIPYGYYVDLTSILLHRGWERIASIDRTEFSWRWNFLAIEYWHHQRRDGLNWYQAIEEMYPASEIEDRFNWHGLIRQGEKPYSLFNNGIPIPPDAVGWDDVRP